MDLRRQSTVHAQELLIHQSRQRQTIERVHARIVHAFRVLDLALLLERKVLGQVPALVVAAQQEQRGRVAELQRPQVQDAFDAEVAAVHVIAQKQILGRRWRATHVKQLHQVVELTVNVAAHSHRRLDLDHCLFRAQQRRSLLDDLQGRRLLDPALKDKVLLQHIRMWLAGARVKHLGYREFVGGREQDRCWIGRGKRLELVEIKH